MAMHIVGPRAPGLSPSSHRGALATLVLLTLAPLAAGQVAWTQLSPGSTPPYRFGHVAFWDEPNGRVILHGGTDRVVDFNDTWEWTNTWTRRFGTAVSPGRAHSAAAWDRVRGRGVLFGGVPFLGSGYYDDTWEWDGFNWIQRSPPTAPSGRYGAAVAHDEARGQTLVFGGRGQGFFESSELWAWDGSTWTLLNTTPQPPVRYIASMAYDAHRQVVVLYGGSGRVGGSPVLLDDTWEWDGSAWTQRFPVASAPPRRSHGMIYDPARRRIVLVGGFGSGATHINDVWEWDGTRWEQRQAGQGPRESGALVYDRLQDRIVDVAPDLIVTIPGMQFGQLEMFEYGPLHPASFTPFGTGCLGSAGRATLAAFEDSRPWTADVFRLEGSGIPARTPAWLLLGVSSQTWLGAPLPFSLDPFGMTGCQILTSSDFILPVANPSGHPILDIPICACPSGIGFAFFPQLVSIDVAANPGAAVLSNSGTAIIGAR